MERFSQGANTSTVTSSFIRRSIHRIEKGLISRPRRDVFAVDYIGETVDALATMSTSSQYRRSEEFQWAAQVLSEYFSVCHGHANIETSRLKFERLTDGVAFTEASRARFRRPYTRDSSSFKGDFLHLLELARHRRSVRWFLPDRVPRQDIYRAMEVATLSPSACNRQPFTFRIFDEEPYLSKAAALPPGTRGFEHQFPCIVAVVGQQRYYADERDRHLIYIDGSLASMSFILALETLGLSSCCINWPDIEERELAAERELKLEPDERIVMFIAVGYADPKGLIPYSEKRMPEELCRFNFG